MNDDDIKIVKDMINIINVLNNQKKDYIKSLFKICIALIISFTIIICCFYLLYFTIQEVLIMWKWLQEHLFPLGRKNKKDKDKEKGDK